MAANITRSEYICFQTCNHIFRCLFNRRPTKGGGYHPPDGLSPAVQRRKRKWLRASRTSLLHPLRSFWWKNRGYPLRWGRVSRQSSKVGGWLPPQNKSLFWKKKYLHGMVLKLPGHVRNTISLRYNKKPGEISIFGPFFAKKKLIFFFFQFWSIFTENPLF